MLEREAVIFPFGIKNGHSRRHLLIRNMMIADNKVYTKRLGKFYFLDSFNATIKDNNEFDTRLLRISYSFLTHPVAFIITIRDIIVNV